MKTLSFLLLTFTLLSCHEGEELDSFPPAAPRGIRTISLDNAVKLDWLANTEPDVEGYNVWTSDQHDGRYELIGSTSETRFVDYGAVNGSTYYYAVSAYDFTGNESDLSYDVAYDTPRPEGFGVQLMESGVDPLRGGYDFSTFSVGLFNDEFTDVFFENVQGLNLLAVWSDTDIQDMGFTSSLDDISYSPSEGWAPSRTAEAIPGHTYVVWTWDDHYAKIRIREVSQTQITFDWAYQTAVGNTELRVTRDVPRKRPPLIRIDHPTVSGK